VAWMDDLARLEVATAEDVRAAIEAYVERTGGPPQDVEGVDWAARGVLLAGRQMARSVKLRWFRPEPLVVSFRERALLRSRRGVRSRSHGHAAGIGQRRDGGSLVSAVANGHALGDGLRSRGREGVPAIGGLSRSP